MPPAKTVVVVVVVSRRVHRRRRPSRGGSLHLGEVHASAGDPAEVGHRGPSRLSAVAAGESRHGGGGGRGGGGAALGQQVTVGVPQVEGAGLWQLPPPAGDGGGRLRREGRWDADDARLGLHGDRASEHRVDWLLLRLLLLL